MSNFKGHSPHEIIHQILLKIKEFIDKDLSYMKYVRQLEVLSNLRNLQEETIKQIETMPFTYNLESDIRYKQGIEKGIERGIEKGIERGIEKGIERGIEKGIERGIEKGIESKSLEIANKMILSGIFSTEQIVDFSGLSLEKVKGLMKKKKKS